MIRFESPGFLLILPLLLLLFLIFRVSRRRKDAVVSSIFIWKKLLTVKQTRFHIDRYRRDLFLLLPFMALTLAVLALSGPVLTASVPSAGRTVVYIIDTSASMQSVYEGGSRFSAARSSVVDSIDSLEPGDRAALLRLDARPDIISSLTDDLNGLQRLASRIEVSDETGDIVAALDMAELLLSNKDSSEVYVFSDRAPLPELLPVYPFGISWIITADSRPNAGITNFALRCNPGTEDEYSLLIEVFSTAGWREPAVLEVYADGVRLFNEEINLTPGTTTQFLRSPAVSPGSALTARLIPSHRSGSPLDALETDNTAYALVPVYPRPKVLCITNGNFFLERALAVQQDFDVYLSSSPFVRGLFDVLITDGVTAEVPYAAAGRISFPARGDLSDLAAVPQNAEVLEKTPVPVVDWSQTHPVLQGVDLSGISVQPAQTNHVLPSGSAEGIVSTAGHDVITAVGNGGRLLFFDFLLSESTLPYSPSFPLLISNALWWSYCGTVPSKQAAFRTGEEIVLPASLPDGVYTFSSEQGFTVEGTVKNHRLLIDHPARSGLYFPESGNTSTGFAVNIFSSEESNILTDATSSEIIPSEEMGILEGEQTEETRSSIPLGPLLLIIMLAVLCTDWFWYREVPER